MAALHASAAQRSQRGQSSSAASLHSKAKQNVVFMAGDLPDRKHPKAECVAPKPRRFTATTQEQTALNTVKKWPRSATSRPWVSRLACLVAHALPGANQSHAAKLVRPMPIRCPSPVSRGDTAPAPQTYIFKKYKNKKSPVL